MSHLEKLCENHCHLHSSDSGKQSNKVVKNSQESFKKTFRPSMDWKCKNTRKLPIPAMVPPPPKVLSVLPRIEVSGQKLYQNLEAQNQNEIGFNHEISPTVAARRIFKLIENLQFIEGANFIHKLPHSTFKSMMECNEFSLQKLIESIPNSLPVLEAIYSKMFVNSLNEEPITLEQLHPQEIVDSLINLFVSTTNQKQKTFESMKSSQSPSASFSLRDKILDQSSILSVKRILKVIMLFDNRIRKQVDLNKRKVDRAIRGLGQHGLVGATNDTLIDLHDAVRIELDKIGTQYRNVVLKLNEMMDTKNTTQTATTVSKSCISKGPAPIESSHQRQLNLNLRDIQERLVKNFRLLNVIESTIGHDRTLEILLDNLRNRIEMDKEAISQVIQIEKKHLKKGKNSVSKNVTVDPETILAPILIEYSTAYSKVLTLFKDLDTEGGGERSEGNHHHHESRSDIVRASSSPSNLVRSAAPTGLSSTASSGGDYCNSDTISGYHSDSDASNNITSASPINNPSSSNDQNDGGKLEQSNLGTNRTNYSSSSFSSPPDLHYHNFPSIESNPHPENEFLVRQISLENQSLRQELASSRKSVSDLQQRQRILLQRLTNQEQSLITTRIPEEKQEGQIFPVNAIRSYGNLFTQSRCKVWNSLENKDEDYKSNLILSILVNSFAVTRNYAEETKSKIMTLPNIDTNEPSNEHFVKQVNDFMVQSRSILESSKCFQIIWSNVLKSFPGLESLNQSRSPLNNFIEECMRIAWYFSVQKPEVVLEFGCDGSTFLDDCHVRFESNSESDRIRSFLWPGLMDSSNGSCLCKAIVVTM